MFTFLKKISQFKSQSKRIYLDHAGAEPLSTEAGLAMQSFWLNNYGNASAIHTEGQQMKKILTDCRQKIASLCEVQPSQVTFTSGGTETNNLALRGVVEKLRQSGRSYQSMEVITTAIEHPATTNTLKYLAGLGVIVKEVAVDQAGEIKLAELENLLSPQTILVCLSYVNSEIGTIQPVLDVSRLVTKIAPEALLFVDSAQAPLWLPCVLPRLRADIITFDGGKFGGPTGVGVMVVSKRVKLAPILFGGGQEQGLRPGTEPVALILGATTALVAAQADHKKRSEAVAKIRDYAWEQIKTAIPQAHLNGAPLNKRVANNLNFSIPGLDSEYAVVVLDQAGIASSTKSACSSAGGGLSKVVLAVTNDEALASSTLRFTFGPEITKADVDKVVRTLKKHLENSVSW